MTDLSGPPPPASNAGADVLSPPSQPSGSFSGLVAAISNIATLLSSLQQTISKTFNLLASNNIFTGTNSFTKPLGLPVYTVALLPAVTLANVGAIAYAANGRNSGEGAASGTGCTVQVQNKAGTATWCAVWSGIQITS
jgi:hypothetical protein